MYHSRAKPIIMSSAFRCGDLENDGDLMQVSFALLDEQRKAIARHQMAACHAALSMPGWHGMSSVCMLCLALISSFVSKRSTILEWIIYCHSSLLSSLFLICTWENADQCLHPCLPIDCHVFGMSRMMTSATHQMMPSSWLRKKHFCDPWAGKRAMTTLKVKVYKSTALMGCWLPQLLRSEVGFVSSKVFRSGGVWGSLVPGRAVLVANHLSGSATPLPWLY